MFKGVITGCLSGVVTYMAADAHAQLPAFPGADGAGAFASGGRGGIVYHVTRLDRNFSDAEVGTLRYGLNNANFPPDTRRTIVFDVGGTFWLGRYGAERPEYNNGWDAQSNYGIPQNITIAGQTAPGPVIIMGGVTKCHGSNVVMRNLTFATGYGMRGFDEPDKDPPRVPTPGEFPDNSIYESLQVSGQNVMLDHLTAVYASAGTIWCRDSADNLTMQYCTIGQGQNYPQEFSAGQYTGRAYGMYADAGPDARISVLNNLYAHFKYALVVYNNTGGSGPVNDFRNNVTYNWLGIAGFTSGAGDSGNNFVNNFYLAGPGGDNASGSNIVYAPGGTGIFSGSAPTRTYVSGNLEDINMDGDPDDTVSADGDFFGTSLQPGAEDVNLGVTLDASSGVSNILHYVGSRWWERDYDFMANNTNSIDTVDERLIHETWTGTGQVMAWADDPFDASPSEGVEWRAMLALRADSNTFAAPFNWPSNRDTDQDGMPDYWETEHGLDPDVANNNGDFDNDGYTDLEEYLNEIAAWPAPGDVIFDGTNSDRYAEIFNWQVQGVSVQVTNAALSNVSMVVPSTKWQPSRYDRAIISNNAVVVDAAGQHAGTIRLAPEAANNATLNITNGWLKVANTLEIATAGTAALNLSGGRLCVSNLVMGAGSGAFNFTGGTLCANVVGFDLLNQGGTIAPGSSPGETHVMGDLTLQSGSFLDMELGGTGPSQSDTIVVDGDLTLAGTVNITNLAGFGTGTYVLITYGGALSGSLALGAQPSGYACTLDTSVPGEIRLIVVGPPVFETFFRSAGGQFVASGSGYSNGVYLLLESTTLDLPSSLWTPVATNMFDGNGKFSITNPINLNESRLFYRLQLQ